MADIIAYGSFIALSLMGLTLILDGAVAYLNDRLGGN